jgi:hypothetical protein
MSWTIPWFVYLFGNLNIGLVWRDFAFFFEFVIKLWKLFYQTSFGLAVANCLKLKHQNH